MRQSGVNTAISSRQVVFPSENGTRLLSEWVQTEKKETDHHSPGALHVEAVFRQKIEPSPAT